MRITKLSLAAKIALTKGLLATLAALTAGYAFHAIVTIDNSCGFTATNTGHKAVLVGELGQAVSEMAAAQYGLVAFTYAKQPDLPSRGLWTRRRARWEAPITGSKKWFNP